MEFQSQNNMYYAGAMQPNQQVVTRFNNALTAEEIERIQKKSSQFSIAITEEEKLRGICNHRMPDGTRDALVEDPMTGNMRCTICNYEFKPVDPSVSIDDIKKSTQVIKDILQTIKLLYIDLPPEAARDYFQIIPLIDKIPALFEFAAKNFNKHEINTWNMGRQPGTINMYNNLMNLFGGGQMMQQPNMNQPVGMPSYPQGFGMPQMGQPQPMMGQPMMSNGFGMPGASQMAAPGYMPQTGGFQYTAPQQTVPATPTVAPATPEAPAAPAVDTVKTSVKA